MNNKISVFVIALASPILVGIYKDNTLSHTLSIEGKTSESLPQLIKQCLEDYDVSNIIYVNGPGSYMAIKVSYIFLKTICITNDIEFYACNGFEVNGNSPIKALGKKYFVQNEDKIISMRVLKENEKLNDFELPLELDFTNYSQDTLPNYQLPAVT